MERAAVWNARPIFITSTFQDMQAERSHLRNVVLPALEEWLRGKRRHIEWIDLRVGVPNAEIADEAERETLVLKVCLEGVKRSRPFLIALIGDRYGWIPPQERAERAVQEIPEASFSTAVANRSVTDLEIDFGAFHQANQAKRCLFFFRKPLRYAEMGDAAGKYADAHSSDLNDEEKQDRKKKLDALKARIKAAFSAQCFDYEAAWDGKAVSGLEAFGKRVEAEIKKVLEAEFAAAPEPTDLTVEDLDRLELADFAEDRAHEFVGRDGLLADLKRHIISEAKEGAPWGLCITGESGSGKSALFGALVQGLAHIKDAPLAERFETTDVLVLAHAAGASPRAASVDVMLLRWIGELAAFLGVAPNLPENPKPDDVDAAFASLLGRAALKKRVVVLLDALDQFEPTPRGRFVTWLPKLWHENARLIATAIPGDASKALAKRTAITLKPIPPLDKEDAEKIAVNISKHYGRTLESKVVEALLGGERWCNPLWLTLATEEVNLVDADDFARAKTYQGSESEKLRDMMADRARDLPPDVPGLYRNTFTHAAELFGAKTAEAFLGLIAVGRVGWRESDFRVLLPKLTGNDWDELEFAQLRRCFRGQLRQRGVGQWDFTHAQMRPAVKAWLNECTEAAKDNVARRSVPTEEVLHTALGDYLLALPVDDPLHVSQTMPHLVWGRDWQTRVANYYGSTSLTDAELAGATSALASIVINSEEDEFRDSKRQVERILSAPGLSDVVRCVVALHFLFSLTDLIDSRVRRATAKRIISSVQQVLSQLTASDQGNADLEQNLMRSTIKIGDLLVAQGDLTEALKAFRDGRAITERLVRTDPSNASWQSDLWGAVERMGDAFVAQGNLSDALEIYREGLAIAKSLVRSDPGNVRHHHNLSLSWVKIGDVLAAIGQLPVALAAYRDGHAIAERMVRSDPDNADWSRCQAVTKGKIGEVLCAQGLLSEASNAFLEGLEILSGLAQSDPDNTGYRRDLWVSWTKIGDVIAAQGYLPEALIAFRDGFAISDTLVRSDPGNASWQRDLSVSLNKIGEVLNSQGNLPEALQAFRDGLAIRERLVRSDPSNADWQHDLAVTLGRVGAVLAAQGHLSDALNALCDGLEVLKCLERSGFSNASWERDLRIFYTKIAELHLTSGDFVKAKGLAEKAHVIATDRAARFPGEMSTVKELDHVLALLRRCQEGAAGPTTPQARVDTSAQPRNNRRDAVSEGRVALVEGNPARALDLLRDAENGSAACFELIGVCQLRLGKVREAERTLHKALFSNDEAVIPDATSPRLVTNYATALLLTGDIRGAKNTLDQVWDKDNPAISRLLDAIDRWEQSLSFWERMKWRFGRAPPKPFHLDPPYGEI